jgi:hypothetical protein
VLRRALGGDGRCGQTVRMATEVYIPTTVTFRGQRLAEVFAVTLYNPDSTDPAGAMTMHGPPSEGARGVLELVGTRDGKTWRVTLSEIEISRATAVGCEFTVFGTAVRVAEAAARG